MSDQLDHNKSPQIESSSKRDTTQKQASSESNQAMSNGSSDEDISQCVSRGIKGLTISNWSETFKCSPELYFIPQDVEEIREILLLAKSSSKKVRVVGRCHSPSDLPFTCDFLISLQYFTRVISINEESCLVKVEAGITVHELNLHLAKHHLALSVLGSVSDLTLGGVISTATHGSGISYQVISGYVKELELLTSSGDLIRCSADDKSDVFYSALCGLGSIGIIISVTLKCEPEFMLQQVMTPSTLDQVLEDLDDHLVTSEHFRFLWFPHTDYVSISHVNRIYNAPVTKYSLIQKISNWIWDYGIGYYSLEFAYYLSIRWPQLTPIINRLWFNLQYSKSSEKIDVSYKIFNFECLFKQFVNEWSIPREKTQVVLFELRRFIESEAEINGSFVHFPIEVRFVAGDDIYLSPSFGRNSCYINIISYRPYGRSIEYQKYWDFFEKIMKESGGRPHWAKAHRVTAVDFVKMYPYFRAWAQVRKRLDPLNMFMNDYMARIFATYPKD